MGISIVKKLVIFYVGYACNVLQISLAGVIQQQTGLLFALQWPTTAEWLRMSFVVVAGFLMSLVPAWRAYRQSLADGLTVKV